MWEKINEHVVAFVVGTLLLGGLLYAVATAHSLSVQVSLIKDELTEYKQSTNASLEVIKEQIAMALLKDGKLSPDQLKDLITKSSNSDNSFTVLLLDMSTPFSKDQLDKLQKFLESMDWQMHEKPDDSSIKGEK